jgi:hypothetical protein
LRITVSSPTFAWSSARRRNRPCTWPDGGNRPRSGVWRRDDRRRCLGRRERHPSRAGLHQGDLCREPPQRDQRRSTASGSFSSST